MGRVNKLPRKYYPYGASIRLLPNMTIASIAPEAHSAALRLYGILSEGRLQERGISPYEVVLAHNRGMMP